MNITGQRLKTMREAKGWTQDEVAQRLNVTRGAVGHWERGKNEPSYDMLIRLARLYDTSTAYLIGETDDPSPLQSTAKGKGRRGARPSEWGKLDEWEQEYVRKVTDEVRELLVKGLLRRDKD